MKRYYLAVDIGASSGRHILSSLEDGKLQLEEVYRFENTLVERNGHLCWALDQLFEEILAGLKACHTIGKIPVSMGIDTWGVDFVLLDDEGRVLGDTVAYRDHRTEGMDEKVYEVIPETELYRHTGIQKQIFNTIYQLMAVKEEEASRLDKATSFLMVPEYFNFLLTGERKNEYTNATTTGMVNANTNSWDTEILNKLGLPEALFGPLHIPGTLVGRLTKACEEKVGFNLDVILPATHDTGSAVIAVPASEEDYIYLSSGTWSLIGIERMKSDTSEKSEAYNFTNEGGYDHRYRYLKNIMGLWMIQSVKRELVEDYSFAELCRLAEEANDFKSRVDVNDSAFLAPESMVEAIKTYCKESGQDVPKTVGELSCCIYQSLAIGYQKAVEEIENLTGKTYEHIHIVGGGSQAGYLNDLTAKYTGKTIYTGPVEATAIGNLLVQMIKAGDFSDLHAARECVRESFGVKAIKA